MMFQVSPKRRLGKTHCRFFNEELWRNHPPNFCGQEVGGKFQKAFCAWFYIKPVGQEYKMNFPSPVQCKTIVQPSYMLLLCLRKVFLGKMLCMQTFRINKHDRCWLLCGSPTASPSSPL